MIVKKKCICKKQFKTTDYRIKDGRGKFCSKKCYYDHAHRPSGLKYILVKENPTSFKKGQKPWNDGLAGKGICKATSGSIKRGERRGITTEFTTERSKGEKNIKWKGEKVGYHGSHTWMQRNYGKANKCENNNGKLGFNCKKISKKYDWAFINKKGFARDREQYIELCHSCHLTYDRRK